MTTYIDSMDHTRFLRPVENQPDANLLTCKLYWKHQKHESALFGGFVTLPRFMFSQASAIESVQDIQRLHQNDRCGFLLVNTVSAPQRQELSDSPEDED